MLKTKYSYILFFVFFLISGNAFPNPSVESTLQKLLQTATDNSLYQGNFLQKQISIALVENYGFQKIAENSHGHFIFHYQSAICVKYKDDAWKRIETERFKVDLGQAVNDIIQGIRIGKNPISNELYEKINSSCGSPEKEQITNFLSDMIDARTEYMRLLKDLDNPLGDNLRTNERRDLENDCQTVCSHLNWEPTSIERAIKTFPKCTDIILNESKAQLLAKNQRIEEEKKRLANLSSRLASRQKDRVTGYGALKFGMYSDDISAEFKSKKCLQSTLSPTFEALNCFDGKVTNLYFNEQHELNGIELIEGVEFNPKLIRDTIGTTSKTFKLSYENPNKQDIHLSNGQITHIVLAAFADWSVVYFATLSRDRQHVYTSMAYYDNAAATKIKARSINAN